MYYLVESLIKMIFQCINKTKKPRKCNGTCEVGCTDSGKLVGHFYGFLMIVERILAKYEEENSKDKGE
jgi:hypothetical protein